MYSIYQIDSCPIECRLSRTSSDWSCEVYLRTRRQAREIQFGPTITDKDEVEDRIRRAQLAILNPSIRAVEFLSSDFPTIRVNERSFSSDLISVRISGRDVDDLSFVDLPGLIASVRDGGREEDIEEVRALVTSFVNKPSCLILLVVSCESWLTPITHCYTLIVLGSRSRKSRRSPSREKGRSNWYSYHSYVMSI